MEQGNTQTGARRANFVSAEEFDRDNRLIQQRLEILLCENAKISLEKSVFHSEQEKVEAAVMRNPLEPQTAFAYFGLLLGTFPPAAIFTRFFIDANIFRGEEFWILAVAFVVNLITATVGYFSGRFIGRTVSEIENKSWHKMILVLPFVGALWGMMAGGAGGIIIFVVGGFFGALVGAAVGSLALPVFTIFHRLLKRGDKIDGKHFLPLAFGIAFIISAFFLGL